MTENPNGTGPRAGSLRDGVRAVLPLSVAVVGFGVSYGLLADAAGMGAVASIFNEGGGVAAATAAAILLNARYGPIGVSVAPVLGGSAWRRLLSAQLVVDESWVIANRGDGTFDRGRLIGAGLTLYVAWVVSTAVGVLGADLLGDPASIGLDAAFPALFLALLWPQLRDRSSILAAAIGGAIALVLTPVAPPGVPIIAGSAACLLGVSRR